jgi:hypothetical protein
VSWTVDLEKKAESGGSIQETRCNAVGRAETRSHVGYFTWNYGVPAVCTLHCAQYFSNGILQRANPPVPPHQHHFYRIMLFRPCTARAPKFIPYIARPHTGSSNLPLKQDAKTPALGDSDPG